MAINPIILAGDGAKWVSLGTAPFQCGDLRYYRPDGGDYFGFKNALAEVLTPDNASIYFYDGQTQIFLVKYDNFIDPDTSAPFVDADTMETWLQANFFKGGTGGGAPGTPGAPGSRIYFGAGAPSGGLGIAKDYYLRTSNGDFYSKSTGAWIVIFNLKGTPGVAGSQIYNTAGVPGGGLGVDGDYALDVTTFNLYQKSVGAWLILVNIKGADGDPGDNGAPGSVWYFGGLAPDDGIGIDGDYYIDTITDDVYHKELGSWAGPVANLRGAEGPTGPPANTRIVSGGSFSIDSADDGNMVSYTGSTPVNCTILAGLRLGFTCTIWQDGTGTITFIPDTGVTLNQEGGFVATKGPFAGVTVACTHIADTFNMQGNMA